MLRPASVCTWIIAIVFAVAVIACIILAMLARETPRLGGGARSKQNEHSPHLVVDALNLAHWLKRDSKPSLTPKAIIAAIDRTAPKLTRVHKGRVIYVLKDRDTRFNDAAARARYQSASERNGVHIAVAERYQDPPSAAVDAKEAGTHASYGRDDFYMGILAHRYGCAVLTADRLRDFGRFRGAIAPFHVIEYAPWRHLPLRDYIRPGSEAYRLYKKPRSVHPGTYFGAKKMGGSHSSESEVSI